MSKIKIKNFGPIKEGFKDTNGNEWIDVKKVTVFIGNQGSGKSTVAKLISTLSWIEKAINRGDLDKDKISHATFYEFFKYQRINNYFRDETEIEFLGDRATIKYNKKQDQDWLFIEMKDIPKFNVPKIMYVPSERNFLSVIENAYGIKNLPDTLYTFAEEFRKGQLELNDKLLELPVGGLKFKYQKDNDSSYIVGDNFELDLLESSSGYQSLIPMYLVTKFLTDELQKSENVLREQLNVEQSVRRNKEIADIMFNASFSEQEKRKKVEAIDSRYLNTCFVNIVEEPEQNLFPSSQQKILNSLLKFNNKNEKNKLIMTTHSPYLINYLTLAVEADKLKQRVNADELRNKLSNIVPLDSTVNSNDLRIYELDEKAGSIKLLDNYKGLPSDENKLNENLAYSNDLFSQLLDIEDQCQ